MEEEEGRYHYFMTPRCYFISQPGSQGAAHLTDRQLFVIPHCSPPKSYTTGKMNSFPELHLLYLHFVAVCGYLPSPPFPSSPLPSPLSGEGVIASSAILCLSDSVSRHHIRSGRFTRHHEPVTCNVGVEPRATPAPTHRLHTPSPLETSVMNTAPRRLEQKA